MCDCENIWLFVIFLGDSLFGKSLYIYLKYNFENEGNVLIDILCFFFVISYLNVKIILIMIEIINFKIILNVLI